MSNVNNFRRFLNTKDITFEEIPYESGGLGFRMLQSLENGPRLILVVSFNDREDIVDLNVYNIAKIDNPLKKEFLHSLLNELNLSYRFTKFIEEENEISASYSFELLGFNDYSDYIFQSLIMLYNAVEKEFPKFMKLQWS